MCGSCRRARHGPDAASGGAGCCAIALAVAALAAAAVIAFLESSAAGGVAYASERWFHECAKWDAGGSRFLVTTFFGGGLAEVSPAGEERVVVADPDVVGRLSLGFAVDTARSRVLVVYADRPPRSGFSAVAAYELGSWRRLFFARLNGPGESSIADDVAVDGDGNAYVTDTKGNKIWKVSPDGKLLSVIQNGTFFQQKGLLNNLITLNGIVYHPNGYLLVVHTSGGHLFKVDLKTEHVRLVRLLQGSLKRGDGMELLSPTKLVVAGTPNRLLESTDDWETASVTGRYVGPMHRLGSSATVKDGDVYINHIIGFGLGKRHVIAKAIFSPVGATS